MERVPEPELMEDPGQAEAYAAADFGEPNALFCEQLGARFSLPAAAAVVDLGCGPADIPLRLAVANPGWTLVGVDGSEAMLDPGRRAIVRSTVADRVRLLCSRLPVVELEGAGFDAVISNSLLHHLHEPDLLWREVIRLGRPGAAVLVMDLMRPADGAEARRLVDAYASDAPQVLRRDFEASLRAAFEPDEVRAQISQAGLDLRVEVVSDRHLLVSGYLSR